jgi:O-antigen/teichoic acid export membrane protein
VSTVAYSPQRPPDIPRVLRVKDSLERSTTGDTTKKYFVNIAWSWIGFITIIGSSTVVMPMLIRRLGTATFGIWALAVSLIEYLWLIDLGFRPATVKFSAEFRALGQINELNCLINTSLGYCFLAGAFILGISWPNVDLIARVLHIQDPAFRFLIRVIGLSWAGGLVFNTFAAVLEGFQRFDLSNRVSIAVTLLRGSFSLALVIAGYGLREMALVLLASQSTGYAMTYWYCRSIYPELRLSPRFISLAMARRIFAYARQVVSGIVGNRVSFAVLPSLVAHFKPVQYVTYYTQTQRMMEYATDAISRVAMVTSPRVSDWFARGYRQEVIDLACFANRYCLCLWGLLASYLFVYGGNLCRVWINQEFGDRAAVLLPLWLVGYTFWISQFVSAGVLMGIARYTAFSITIFLESIASIACMAFLLPRYGLAASVASLSAVMAISRCLVLSRIFAREFSLSQVHYLWSIVRRPLLLIGCSVGGLLVLREFIVPGKTLFQLISIGVVFALLYATFAFRFVVEREHRQFVLAKALVRWNRLCSRRAAQA